MKTKQKVPKLKKGAWFVKVRGSYLPMTPQAWLMHALLIASCVTIIYNACNHDDRALILVLPGVALEFIGLGAIFTWIASKKS